MTEVPFRGEEIQIGVFDYETGIARIDDETYNEVIDYIRTPLSINGTPTDELADESMWKCIPPPPDQHIKEASTKDVVVDEDDSPFSDKMSAYFMFVIFLVVASAALSIALIIILFLAMSVTFFWDFVMGIIQSILGG